MADDAGAPRIPPLVAAGWDPSIHGLRDILARRGQAGGEPFDVFRTIANHPGLFDAWMGFASHLLMSSSMDGRIRELVILRTAWLERSDYEWAHHVVIAGDLGFTSEDLAAVQAGPGEMTWTPLEDAALRAVDDVVVEGEVSQATWDLLTAEGLDAQQFLDLLFTIGAYRMLGTVLKSAGVRPEPGFEERVT